MNKAFEKIIEILKRKKKNADIEGGYHGDGKYCAFIEAIEIVKEIAEEYNGGWIPCSDSLPKAEDLHNHSIDDCIQYLIQRKCGVMDVAHYIKIYGESYFEANSMEIKDVIAWQPLPEPYKPERVREMKDSYDEK